MDKHKVRLGFKDCPFVVLGDLLLSRYFEGVKTKRALEI